MNKVVVNSVSSILKFANVISNKLAVSIAYYIFCVPSVRSKIKTHESAFMAQAKRGNIDFNGKSVQYYHWGNGEHPVLLIHGWESRGSRFALIMQQLVENGYSPVTFDFPGHGESEGRRTTIVECNAICSELDSKFGEFEAVIAHSFGVCCAFHALKNSISSPKIIAISGFSDFIYLVDQFTRILKLNDETRAGLIVRLEKLFEPIDNVWNRFSVDYEAHKVTQSILVIHDKSDDIVLIEQGKKIVQHFAQQAQFVETNGLGHRRVLIADEVLSSVDKFMSSTV